MVCGSVAYLGVGGSTIASLDGSTLAQGPLEDTARDCTDIASDLNYSTPDRDLTLALT